MFTPNQIEPRLRSAFSKPLQVAFQAAEAASQIIVGYFDRGVAMRSKAGGEQHDLVSDADLDSERAIADILQRAFPGHAILGEEENSGAVDATDLWIIDPLDGTNNFAHRIPHFAVSIAYYHRGNPVCGVVVNPVRGDWYWAERGHGAYHNGRLLSVSRETSLSQTMVGVGFYYDRGAMMEATLKSIHSLFKEQIHGIRRFGAAALDLCYVADGLFGVFFEYHLSPWDFAAGRIMLEEAGGKISDGRGNPIPLAKSSILASNGPLHGAALEIVRRNHL
jgi:myo-inositol-1(or 4)-monophosphatase